MSLFGIVGRTLGMAIRASAGLAAGGVHTGRFFGRQVLVVRRRAAAGEAGMLRLLDLHAASCAGDTLIAIGLAGTIFFAVPAGEARGGVALYLLITMLPFALLAPVVGPVLDRFRHGRRYALATTMLGRAFLAYMISEHIGGLTLYPAALGILVLSRAYGVARSAAVPRLLPAGLGLSEAGARASVFGTFAGAAVVPIGLATYAIGPAWPLRIAMIIFGYGMITALRLPPRADCDPPETMPRLFQRRGHRGAKALSGRVVLTAVAGSATLRAVYGFLALYLAFAIRSEDLDTRLFGWTLAQPNALLVIVGALGLGSFLATAIGANLRIRRPALLQAGGIVAVAVTALAAALIHTLPAVMLLCFATAVASGLAKLAVDATIQERIDDRVRASAFAHSETLLMLAWVAGGALGLVPFDGRWGMGVAAALIAVGAARAVLAAVAHRRERLHGTPHDPAGGPQDSTRTADPDAPTERIAAAGAATARLAATPGAAATAGSAATTKLPSVAVPAPAAPKPTRRFGWLQRRPKPAAGAAVKAGRARTDDATRGPAGTRGPAQTHRETHRPAESRADGHPDAPAPAPTPTPRTSVDTEEATLTSPGFHLYRPSGIDPTNRLLEPDSDDPDPRGP